MAEEGVKLLSVAVEAAITPTGRTCGDCSLCCKLLPVAELKKPRSQWCQHCDPKSSTPCKIYDRRPGSCASWSCLWIVDKTIPDNKKPNKSHVAWDVMVDYFVQGERRFDAVVAWVDPAYPMTWKEDWFVKLVVLYAHMYNLPTMVRIGWKVVVMVPPEIAPDNKWMIFHSTITDYENWTKDDDWQIEDLKRHVRQEG